MRYRIKAYRRSKEEEWRKVGTEKVPAFVLLNKERFKVGGENFELEGVTGTVRREKVQMEEESEV